MAIYGLGVSGLACLKFLSTQSDVDLIAVSAGEVKDWPNLGDILKFVSRDSCFCENEAQEILASVDVIVKSPGIPLDHTALALAQSKQVSIISEIELAFGYCHLPVIAVTGTNGKTTTVTLIAQLLERMGKRPFLCGNIGRPFIELFEQGQELFDYAVVEVSSFQLETVINFHPRVAVFTNLGHSHGERYAVHEHYRDAKLRLFQNMTQKDTAIAHHSLASDLNLPCPTLASDVEKLNARFSFENSALLGQHNKENLYFAWKAVESLLGGGSALEEALQSLIDDFEPVSYRTQIIKRFGDTVLVNDGKSTNLDSTIAAINCFPNQEIDLILGGKLRDETMELERLRNFRLRGIYAFGESATFINKKLGSIFPVYCDNDLELACARLSNFTKKSDKGGGVILFSPAFPSFDLYSNYVARAKHFNQLAEELF